MTGYSDFNEWNKLYFAVGLHTGAIHVYNINHKITYTTPQIKSSVLSLATSRKVQCAM